jgi:enediyne biosynthesis protein E4
LLFSIINSCTYFEKNTRFKLLDPNKSGISFENKVQENERTNVLEYMNIYTGAGVAAADFNQDGLVDLFFAGNQVSSKLYLNRGDLRFEDVTERAGLTTDRWCTGVSTVDINADGWLDIYLCVSGNAAWHNTANLLYINQKDGTFQENAAEYGLAEQRLCMHAVFFDYDRDGDLDAFLATNPADQMVTGVNNVTANAPETERKGIDILYRNDGNGHFTDVSHEAGITEDGYSLGVTVSDFNQDGWVDIYVANDFLSSDVFYINQGNGTFKNQLNQSFKHTSFASMGTDAADVNNDGLTDLFVLDMLPEDNYRRKMLIPPTNIDKFNLAIERGYARQYTRNTLQLNHGCQQQGLAANPQFSDAALMAGVAATDWSWAPLFADFDLDGDKDIFVSNGFYRDLGDLDYINYQFTQRSPMGSDNAKRNKKLADIHGLPNVPLQHYLFEHQGQQPVPTFKKSNDTWGLEEKGFSNGACYADLDNDGDQELILNTLNSPAKVYENTSRQAKSPPHYLTVQLQGDRLNPFAYGAKVTVFTGTNQQLIEVQPARGYESSMDIRPCFGLDTCAQVDSIIVIWPQGQKQIIPSVNANQCLIINQLDNLSQSQIAIAPPESLYFSAAQMAPYTHIENYFIDFKTQVLLPHGHSRQGPAIATADVNRDGLTDYFVSGAMGGRSTFFIQKTDGSGFDPKTLETACPADEPAAYFFDADGDKDQDLYVARGGSEHQEGAEALQDALFINDGKGNFTPLPLPDTKAAGGCVTILDFDLDNDLDVFVGGHVAGGAYPRAPRSHLLQNDGRGQFTDATPNALKNIGMVTASEHYDINQDGWDDLILVGEWMPITFVLNQKGQLNTLKTLENTSGWWNCISLADIDNDGDLDLLAGNQGTNTRYKASASAPLMLYSKDFDNNGSIEAIITHIDGGQREIFHTRDELATQIPAMKKRFSTFNQYAKTSFEQSFRSEELAGALKLDAVLLESCWFENKGNDQFATHTLPLAAQMAPIQSFFTSDFNADGNIDFIAVGNSYETDYTTGQYDASKGACFLGDSNGGFTFVPNRVSGFWADGDARDLAFLYMKNNDKRLIIAQNNGAIQAVTCKWKMAQ